MHERRAMAATNPFPGMNPYDDVDYQKEPEPPLGGKDGVWMDEMLKAGSCHAPLTRVPSGKKYDSAADAFAF